MKTICSLVTYTSVLLVHLLSYLGEVGLHLATACQLYQENHHIWLSLLIGMLVVPTVAGQCVSIYQSWDTHYTTRSRIIWGILHLFLLAIPSRYSRLLLHCGAVDSHEDFAETVQLRSYLALTSTLPLALLEVYILFNDSLPQSSNKVVIASASVAIFSAASSLSSFKKRKRDYRFLETILSWPGIGLNFFWRLGELGSRVTVLALFAQLYTLWIFMVLAGHWICMLVSLVMETKMKSKESSFTIKSALRLLATSYAFVFCYVNVTTKPERYRFVVFYLIMSAENALLLLLWLLYDIRDHLHLPVSVAVVVVFVLSVTFAMLYYHCFHEKSIDKPRASHDSNSIEQCINCKLSLCVNHNRNLQRPCENGWWMEVNTGASDQDSVDYLYPSEYVINSKELPPGVQTAVLVPVQDVTDQGKGRIVYFRQFRDVAETGSATSASGAYLIPFSDPAEDSASDTSSWDNYDPQNDIEADKDAANAVQGCASNGIEEMPSTDTGTQPRESNKPSDSGFSASTSSRSGSRLSPFSQGEYVLYISDNDDSDISTSFVSTEQGAVGGRPIRYYLSDQWSVTTSTTDTLDRSHKPPRRLLYRLPGGLAKLQETKSGKAKDNAGFVPDADVVDSDEGRVVLFPVKMCRTCGSSSSSPAVEKRDLRPIARKAISERMLAERRRARKQRMANAKLISRNRQHFKSQMAQLRRKMESSGLSDADCSVVGVVISSCPSDLNSSNERLAVIQKKPKEDSKPVTSDHSKQKFHRNQKKRKESAKPTDVKPKKKPWELTPENTIQFKEKPKRKSNLSPAGFEVNFDGSSKPFAKEKQPSQIDGNATITV